MTSRDTYQRHVQCVLRVVHYLWQHPQQETPLAVLAEMAHFSPYHFHRTYVAVMGESVNETRQRLRLQLAALALRRQPGSPLPLSCAPSARRTACRRVAIVSTVSSACNTCPVWRTPCTPPNSAP